MEKEWIDTFVKKYLYGSKEECYEAMKYKNSRIPHYLYRYRSLDELDKIKFRLDELEKGNVFLTHPRDLNDPYDFIGYVDIHRHVKQKYPNCQDKQWSELLSINKKLNLLSEREINEIKIFQDILSLTTMKSISCNSNSKIEIVKENVCGSNNSLNGSITNLSSKMTDKMMRPDDDGIGVCCFTTSKTNMPMWNHYAANFNGICIEYVTDKWPDYDRQILFPVNYIDNIVDVTEYVFSKNHPCIKFAHIAALYKLRDWEYECEWRQVWASGISNDNHRIRNIGGITKCHIGYNVTNGLKQRIIDIARNRNFKVFAMQFTSKGIGFKEI